MRCSKATVFCVCVFGVLATGIARCAAGCKASGYRAGAWLQACVAQTLRPGLRDSRASVWVKAAAFAAVLRPDAAGCLRGRPVEWGGCAQHEGICCLLPRWRESNAAHWLGLWQERGYGSCGPVVRIAGAL
eukprot:XP_001694801.1 predicted protein [Chlamydomonas reinhardtii]